MYPTTILFKAFRANTDKAVEITMKSKYPAVQFPIYYNSQTGVKYHNTDQSYSKKKFYN